MPEWHISEALARDFLRDQATPADRKRVVGHLIGKCKQCRRRVTRIAAEEGIFPKQGRRDYTIPEPLMFPAAESFDIAMSKVMGLAQWSALESMDPGRRAEIVGRDKSFHHFGLYDRLLEVAAFIGRTEPQEAEDVAMLALQIAPNVRLVPDSFRQDLIAGAYGAVGNARRLRADYKGAQDAFTEAWRRIEEGSGDPLVSARIQQFESSWFNDLGRYNEAEQLLELALRSYRSVHDEHREGRTILKLGCVRMKWDPESAIVLFLEAETLYDPAEEPFLEWCVRHNTVWCLNDLERPKEALALLEESRPLYRKFSDPWVRLRGYWLEARIAFSFGKYQDAEEIFKSLWEQVRAEGGHPIDLTLLSVDLAQVLAERGMVPQCVRLIEQLIPILRSIGLHDEGLAVWLLVAQKLQSAGKVGSVLWRELEDYFRRNFRVPVRFGGDVQ
jgi:tetratricopeptide (TPR) repeat protein